MKRTLFILLLAGLAVVARTPVVLAAGLTVTPAVIDAQGLPDDLMSYSLTVTNTDDHMVNVFASVYDLTADGAQAFTDPSDSDRPASLADWISVSRASMIFQPGQTETIPVGIQIDPYATAGTYHAVIAFVEGGTRADAETHLDGAPQALIDVEVQSNAKEVLTLTGFSAAKPFSSGFPVAFTYTLRNDGNVASTPSGPVVFYDRIGHELGSTPANPNNIAIAPGTSQSFTVELGSGEGFGQYKADLQLVYDGNGATIEDAALIWVLPWQKVLVLFGGLLAVVIVLAVFLHRQYEKRHRYRMDIMARLATRRKDVIDLRPPHERHD